jgi:acyl-CoA synthetase (AMP-forming)/AMP-acid ligase II
VGCDRTPAVRPAQTAQAIAAADCTLAGLFRRSAALFAERAAIVSETARLSYRELDMRSNQLAHAFMGAGLARGERIAVLSTTRPEFAEVYVAAAKAGITVVALNIRMHPDELAYCAELSRPRLLLASPDQLETAAHITDRCTCVEQLLAFGGPDGSPGYEPFVASGQTGEVDVDVRGEDIHNILFTSGTTGRPKGALISQRAAAVRALRVAHWYSLGVEDGFIGWLPLFHCGGDEPLYATLLSGGRVATLEKADVGAMYRLTERERLTWTLLLPGVITAFLEDPRKERHDLSSLRFAIGYANMMPATVMRLTSTFGISFWDAFGQTETSFLLAQGCITPGVEPSLRKAPTPLMEIRIVEEDMRDCALEQPGECVVRGPSVMSGYLGDAAATEAVFRGGWLHTGDVLVQHSDGTLSYVDRKKYLIKTGGENVYPAEVEQVIATHPEVQEVCVHGIPDPYWGEAIRAAIVLAPGAHVSPAELRQWCRERLAGYKRPRLVLFLSTEEMPRSTTGKILRHELSALPITDQQRADDPPAPDSASP